VFLVPPSVLAALSPINAALAQLFQCANRTLDPEHHLTASSTISSIGSATGYELLAAESHHSISAISGPNDDLYAVYHVI
jgi:hypothetical protein